MVIGWWHSDQRRRLGQEDATGWPREREKSIKLWSRRQFNAFMKITSSIDLSSTIVKKRSRRHTLWWDYRKFVEFSILRRRQPEIELKEESDLKLWLNDSRSPISWSRFIEFPTPLSSNTMSLIPSRLTNHRTQLHPLRFYELFAETKLQAKISPADLCHY